jgi:FlaG/FlaF family flagellin (archaellin)
MYLSKLRKDIRAISPVLAVLMMIVIAVAGSLVTYAWVMGYLSFTTAKAGRAIQIQSVANSGDDLVVYVQNVGEGTVELDPTGLAIVYVNGGLSPVSAMDPADGLLLQGNTATLTIAGAAAGPGERTRVKVVSMGGTFTEAASYPGESTGGGGVILPPPTVTQVSSTDTGFSGVEAGDLLVVIPNHRTGTFVTDGETCTAAGYTTVEVAAFMQVGTGDRRAVAVLIKVADGTESGTVTCTWGGGASTYTTIYQIYRGATTWTPGASDVDHNGGTSTGTSLSISGLPTSSTANVLTIGALVTRGTPGTVTITNLAGQDASDSGSCFTVTEFNYGDAVSETVMSYTNTVHASGLLAQFTCT